MRHSIPILIVLGLLTLTLEALEASTRTPVASIDIELLPASVQPGEEYEIRYAAREPGYVILYAIDTRGYINLLYPLDPELDGDGEVLPGQEYALSKVVAGVRPGQERVVALFTRNYLEIPQQRWEFLSRDPDDIIEINYSLTRRTSGLSNFSIAILAVDYQLQGTTSPDYELPDQVEVVYVYLQAPDPWYYYSGFHYSWWWHYDRYWYPHRYHYWHVSWHPWYGPFYDPWYGPWHYGWYDPWYYHHHGHYCWWDGYYYSGWHHVGYDPPPPVSTTPRVHRNFDRRRTTSMPDPDYSRLVAQPAGKTVTDIAREHERRENYAVAAASAPEQPDSPVGIGAPGHSAQQGTSRAWYSKSKRKSSGSAVRVTSGRSQSVQKRTSVAPAKPAKRKSSSSTPKNNKSSNSDSGKKKKKSTSSSAKQSKHR